MKNITKTLLAGLILLSISQGALLAQEKQDLSACLKTYPFIKTEIINPENVICDKSDNYLITVEDKDLSATLNIFNIKEEKKIYQENYDQQIKSYNVFSVDSPSSSFPDNILLVEYISLRGTGCYGTSIKLYSIKNDKVTEVLERPKYEVNSGWGAFKEEAVTFDSNIKEVIANDDLTIIIQSSVKLQNKLSGTEEETKEIIKEIPEETYKWDKNKETFIQTKGRLTIYKKLMSEIYGDYATIEGDWFKKPEELE